MMGLAWSIDDSLVFFFLGASAYFFFLGVWNRPGSKQFSATGTREGSGSFFSGKKFSQQRSTVDVGPSQAAKSKFVLIIFVFTFFIVFAVVLPIIFSSGDNLSVDAIMYYQNAEMFRNNGQYDSAAANYQKALAADPEYTEAMVGYGNNFIALNNNDAALDWFNKAIALKPDETYAYYSRGILFYNQKNYDKSLKEAYRIMEINPTYYDATLLAGDNFYIRNRYDSAIYWYEQGYNNGLRSQSLCHVMAYIYDTQGKTGQAIPLYKEALSYDTTVTDIHRRLGELIPGIEGERYREAARKLNNSGI